MGISLAKEIGKIYGENAVDSLAKINAALEVGEELKIKGLPQIIYDLRDNNAPIELINLVNALSSHGIKNNTISIEEYMKQHEENIKTELDHSLLQQLSILNNGEAHTDINISIQEKTPGEKPTPSNTNKPKT